MRTGFTIAAILLVAAAPVHSQVTIERHGDENPVAAIAKATAWGGLAGLLLGSAVALVADDNEGDIIKWFFVGGVFGGFGYGIYHVTTRPEPPSALLRIDSDGMEWRFPAVAFERGMAGGRDDIRGAVNLVSLDF
jgi:hypothetical protein